MKYLTCQGIPAMFPSHGGSARGPSSLSAAGAGSSLPWDQRERNHGSGRQKRTFPAPFFGSLWYNLCKMLFLWPSWKIFFAEFALFYHTKGSLTTERSLWVRRNRRFFCRLPAPAFALSRAEACLCVAKPGRI